MNSENLVFRVICEYADEETAYETTGFNDAVRYYKYKVRSGVASRVALYAMVEEHLRKKKGGNEL